jgi:hypothetical protein
MFTVNVGINIIMSASLKNKKKCVTENDIISRLHLLNINK